MHCWVTLFLLLTHLVGYLSLNWSIFCVWFTFLINIFHYIFRIMFNRDKLIWHVFLRKRCQAWVICMLTRIKHRSSASYFWWLRMILTIMVVQILGWWIYYERASIWVLNYNGRLKPWWKSIECVSFRGNGACLKILLSTHWTQGMSLLSRNLLVYFRIWTSCNVFFADNSCFLSR